MKKIGWAKSDVIKYRYPFQNRTYVEQIQLKLSAVAEVKKGNMPVIGARVRAYITRPGDSGTTPPLEMELSDNGSGEVDILISILLSL